MSKIRQNTEERIQELMLRSKPIFVEGTITYMFDFRGEYFIRYIQGHQHLTISCRFEYLHEPWYFWISILARWLFAPRIYVVEMTMPVAWDNELDPISGDEITVIARRIKNAVLTKYQKCRVEMKSEMAESIS